jgi:Ca2+-binding RTX toxin-like protein
MAGSLLLGVNLAGAEFGSNVPGVFGTDYTYPTHAEIDYYAAKGMGVIRLPFLWERVQRSEFAALDATELGRLDDVVNYATGKGLKIEIEPHNYGYGFGALIGTAQTPNSAFADLWGKLAGHFQSNSGVIFGLMNEPHDQSASAWLGSANAAIAAIRGAGAMSQEILVPGSYWDGAWTWVSSDNDTVIGAGVQDPAHNFAFEVHQYLDADGSGTHFGAVSATIGVERLTAITQWAEATGNRLFLGEVGVTTDQTSLTAFDCMLTYMQQHTGAWQGVTYWAGGPWWGNYMFSIEPQNGVDKPQMGILVQHLSAPSGDYNGTPGNDAFSTTGNLLHAYGNDGNDQLSITGNQNQLFGGNGDDALSANGASNVLHGDAGNDMLTVSGGVNQLYGGTGNDAYSVDNTSDAVNENASEGIDTVYTTTHFRLPANVENLVLQGSADLQAYGNGASNAIYGNSGINILDGGGGADGMFGGAGNDVYFVDDAGDAVVENPGEGNDTVFSTAHFRLPSNIENLVLQGNADLQGYGNNFGNLIYGNAGNNLLDGGGGADGMVGGAGNDVYFVDDPGDAVIENPNNGNDTVFSTAHFRLSSNVENLVLQGSADLQGYGNGDSNALYGNSGINLLDGGAGADMLTGGAGNDVFLFQGGQAAGDTVVDFAGNGAAPGDSLLFLGYGPGATFTNIDAAHWQVNFNGSSHEVITFMNGAAIDASDVMFS